MVFIEERNKYFYSLTGKPKQEALFALVSDETFQIPQKQMSETDSIYYSSVKAIKNNSKDEFNNQYNKISKRKVSENSTAPFIQDDFLIFTLITGVLKFNCEKEWLLGLIETRAKNSTTTTFKNLLTGNYQSKENIQSLILVFLFLIDKTKIKNEQLAEAYNAMIESPHSYGNDFIRIINYRAFDIIIQLKIPMDTDKVSRLLKFEAKFKRRMNVLSYIVYNALLLFLLIASYQIMDSLPQDWKSKVNDLAVILGLAGTGLVVNLIPKLRKKFKEWLMIICGYPIQFFSDNE